MKLRQLLLLALVLIVFNQGNAQPYTFTGTIKDTVSYHTTMYTSVSLVNAKDSLLAGFTRADEDGNFAISVDSPGNYLILIAHPLFANYVEEVATNGNTSQLGNIYLFSKLHILQEVIVSDRRAITIKGDTTEYAADSFKVRAFDNVDELLKRLPGIEVDKDGNIKAHGEKVKKMMVDGDEFFADDPAMVAKMLRASAVDKVQVFDSKSEQAEFTGIDDGEKIKTINLQLKENAKKGYFGKAVAGVGTNEFWENQLMLNAFKAKRKIAAFGIMSNTNTSGLGWDDANKYGGGASMEFGDDGSVMMSREMDGDSDWNGNFRGEGLPKTWTGGVHYGNKWLDKDALEFNADYAFNKNNIEAFNNTRTQYTLPDTQYINNSESNSFSEQESNRISTTTVYKLDSLTEINLRLGGRYNKTLNSSRNNVSSTNLAGDYINQSEQQNDRNSIEKSVNASLTIRRKFEKKGRSFSASVNTSWNDRETDGNLYTLNNYYALGYTDTVNQRKESTNNTLKFGSRLSYTEPLSKKIFLELNYSLNVNNNQNATYSYDKLAESNLDTLNRLFSSDYGLNILTNSFGSNLRFNFDKLSFSFGGNLSNAAFTQINNFDQSTLKYNYLNFFPRANLKFARTKQSSFSFNYNGNSRQPSIFELRPIRENNDPLNVMVGNPNLKQEFTHNFSISANDYKVLTSRSIYASMNYSFTQNAITQSQSVDEGGRRTYQSINLDGNMNGGFWMGYWTNIKFLKAHGGIGANGNISRNHSMINGLKNRSNNLSFGPNLNLSYYKDTLLSINYQVSSMYNRNNSSIRPEIITDYWSLNQNFSGSINLPLNFEMGTQIDWFIRQKMDQQDQNNNVFKMNAYISKAFLKNRSLVAKIAGYDIFNQNVGFRRSVQDNYFTESRFNNIRRYFMLSLTWNFTKTAAMAAPSEASSLLVE
jgi:hypothetical protein